MTTQAALTTVAALFNFLAGYLLEAERSEKGEVRQTEDRLVALVSNAFL